MIELVIPFPAGQSDFFSIDYNDVVTCIDVRCIDGLVLPLEAGGNKTGQPPQDALTGIYNEPIPLYFCWFCTVSFHDSNLFEFPDFRKRNIYYPVNALSREKKVVGEAVSDSSPLTGAWLIPATVIISFDILLYF